MITIDTSLLIRYLTHDNELRANAVIELLENTLTAENPGLITTIALLEVHWVLRRKYAGSDIAVRAAIGVLMKSPKLVFEHHTAVSAALASSAGFADALIHEIGRNLGASKTITFDHKFAQLPGVELLAND